MEEVRVESNCDEDNSDEDDDFNCSLYGGVRGSKGGTRGLSRGLGGLSRGLGGLGWD